VAILSAAACGSSSSDATPGSSSGAARPPRGDSGFGGEGGGGDALVAPAEGGLFDVDAGGPPPPVGAGHVLFRLPDSHWHRLLAKSGSQPEDVSAALDSISRGDDSTMNISKDGAWLVAIGSRFGCGTGSCVSVFSGDLSKGEPIVSAGKAITTGNGRAAVASGGNVVVYPAAGPHPLDLYAIKRSGGVWGAPVLLTANSTFDYHHDVAIARDGSRVVFDCGGDEYGAPPTSICEVGTDGLGFHEVCSPAAGPDQSTHHALHHADYTPAGDIVFEADWPSEQVWKLAKAGGAPAKISPANEGDDNSPCALPDGRILSLWLGRPDNTANGHEIKAMNADGSGTDMLLMDVDVVDVGIGCGN
jgi:hypothetical protein